MNLAGEFMRGLATKIDGRTATTCSRWSSRYRMMGTPFPGLYSTRYFPWIREIQDSDANEIVLRKGAQVGLSEACINIAFFSLDKKKVNVSYFLPTISPDAETFSRTRIGAAISMSPYIRGMFTGTDQSGIKRTATNTLYIRGAGVSRQLKTIDTAVTICDEADEFPPYAVPMIRKRMAGQLSENKKLIGCSTPSVFGSPIDRWFQESTMEYPFFKCPCCSRSIQFKFPESLVITAEKPTDPRIKDSYYICYECKGRLEQNLKYEYLASLEWVASQESLIRGFQIDEMYSSTVQPWEMAQDWLRGIDDPYAEQEFYNSNLGRPHVVDNSSVTDADLEDRTRAYRLDDLLKVDGIRTMGIDVGKELHYVVKQWDFPDGFHSPEINEDAHCRYVTVGKVKEFDQLDDIVKKYRPFCSVIDAMPEKRQSKQFAMKYMGRAYVCYYNNDVRERSANLAPNELAVSCDRTSWLDITLGRFKNKTTLLPADMPMEFKTHVKNLIRSYRLDKEKNRQVAEYKKVGPDHYAHADNYAEIALNLVHQLGVSGNI